MDLNNMLNKETPADYYISKQAERAFMLDTIKKESKEQLEDDTYKFWLQMEKAKDYLSNKKFLGKKRINELWNILSFKDKTKN